MNCTIANGIIPQVETKINLALPRSFIIGQK